MADYKVMLFPEVFPQIQKEIATYHPELVAKLKAPSTLLEPNESFSSAVAHICTYCDVLVHDKYTPQDIVGLLEGLLVKLKERRPGRAKATELAILHSDVKH